MTRGDLGGVLVLITGPIELATRPDTLRPLPASSDRPQCLAAAR